ncbi:hypothetical protein [Luteolibacter marinus]|uniref:hypothetical protein n=1 Tax=Luteolibacter marinus TaxID=2776705 RepID=UPI0018674706|nr:hypothetical protein [Luteolibacter marinus]
MKPALKIATHLGAAAVGVALAATVLPHLSPSGISGQSSGDAQAHSPAEAADGMRGKKSGGQRGESRSAVFRAAWAALAKEPLGPQARFKAQQKLLAEWAQVDLSGAIDAYLGEAWDGNDWQYNHRSLGQAFLTAFSEQPLEAWKVLQSNKMALHLLGDAWIAGVVRTEPGLVASMLGEIPAQFHAQAVAYLTSGFPVTPEGTHEEMIAKMAASGTPRQLEGWMSMMYQNRPATGDPALLHEEWNALPAGGERTRGMAAWASALREADPEAFAAEWEKLAPEDRGQASRLLLAQVNNKSPALLDVIDHAIEAEQWQALSAGVADKLRGFQTDRKALSEWALELPAREEVRGIFNLSISERLLEDPVSGRAWLEQLPPGDWHRECGFIEMMLGSLWVKNDRAAAQRAIDGITDQRAREEAIKARYDWQLITSQPDVIRVD